MRQLFVGVVLVGATFLTGCGGSEEISLESPTTAPLEAAETASPSVEPETAPTLEESPSPTGPTDGDLRVITNYWEQYPAFAQDEYCRIWRVEKVAEADRTTFAAGFAEPMAEPDYKLIRPDEVDAFSEYWKVFLDETCL